MISIFSKTAEYLFGKSEVDASSEESDNDQESNDCKESKTIFGTITDLFEQYGMVNHELYFSISDTIGGYFPKLGDSVTGQAVRNNASDHWKVMQLQMLETWDENSTTLMEDIKTNALKLEDLKSEVGKVTSLEQNFMTINGEKYEISKTVACDFELVCGDWVSASLKTNECDGSLVVNQISALRPCHIEGEVTGIRRGFGVINFEVYFSIGLCQNGYYPKCGDHVHADVIESHQQHLKWRAIKLLPSTDSKQVLSMKRFQAKKSPFQSNYKSELMSDKNGISVTETLNFGMLSKDGESRYITAWIRNKSSVSQQMLGCRIPSTGESPFCIKSYGVHHANGKTVSLGTCFSTFELNPGTAVFCNIMCSPRYLGKFEEILICEFKGFSIGRYIYSDIHDELLAELHSAQPYIKKKTNNVFKSDQNRKDDVIPGEKIKRGKNFIPVHLPHSRVPATLSDRISTKEDLLSTFPYLLEDLDVENYKRQMSTLLHLEEIQQTIEMREFDLHRVCMRNFGEYLALVVPGLAERRPSLLIGDRVIVTNPGNDQGPAFEGYIHQVLSTEILLKFNQVFHNKYNGEDYDVKFELNRTSMRRCHQSVQLAIKLLGESVLFPNRLQPKIPQVLFQQTQNKNFRTFSSIEHAQCKANRWKHYRPDENINGREISSQTTCDKNINYLRFPNVKRQSKVAAKFSLPPSHQTSANGAQCHSTDAKFIVPNVFKMPKLADVSSKVDDSNSFEISWMNKDLNSRQKSAVKRILIGSSRPVPYILFGPPGTGKTVTLVEAIIQTFKLIPSSRILASTPSNSAADLIVERLHDTGIIQTIDLIRVNAFQRNLEGVSENVKRYSNEKCEIESAAHRRIIICTCMTSGVFYSLGLKEGHFTHVFVDESGQATEPECLTSVTLAAGQDCQVVLAGDPLQLGPVLRSAPAKLYGLQTSLLERLMKRRMYKRDSEQFEDHGNYNPLLVTKLVQNYRSHHSILKFPSNEFYDDELIPCADKDLVNKFCDWDELPNPNLPIVFHGVVGVDSREGDSPSWFNPTEVFQCIYYLRQLLDIGVDPADIGIITPYKKQVEKIRFMMSSLELPTMKVGSVEEFQGQERPVIILSTVRSTSNLISFDVNHNLGFLSNPKRFNVAITRAQALLIIVGNPHVLKEDHYWGSFLDYCIQNKCYIGPSIENLFCDSDNE